MNIDEFSQRCLDLQKKLVPVLIEEDDGIICIIVLVRLMNKFISCQEDPALALSKILDYIPKALASEEEVLKENNDH